MFLIFNIITNKLFSLLFHDIVFDNKYVDNSIMIFVCSLFLDSNCDINSIYFTIPFKIQLKILEIIKKNNYR